MLGQLRRLSIVASLVALALPAPALALTLQVTVAGQSVQVTDNSKLDAEKTSGTIRYAGQVGDVEVRATAVEELTARGQRALTLSGPTGSEGPEPMITNAGEPGTEITLSVTSSDFETLGPETRTSLHYQGQITDVEDARLALDVPQNQLSALVGSQTATSIQIPAVQSEGEQSNFEQKSPPAQLSGEVKNIGLSLQVKLGSGDALLVDEARVVTATVEQSFNLASIAGIAVALVVIAIGLVLFLRPRRRVRR
ncbi:hypothetical protein [Gloeobacter kilaueensis]|uniref:Uncharacterized protein n=1 Tax=Gloeobacter kilaueensis (strain ATCC BAA-2537 / CCAP 1431/1 / ULC 316 / JS1) TaxID=1183438 RepID=U5QEJ1_GLOK1|nr:hypothetical protein [Gloeobacter kilaueensis]AGY57311.1 hypothetical protein GKIL_1065 [Gloeobacter kilaueensis JS1]